MSLDNVALSRYLLPLTLAGLYFEVTLRSPDMVEQFAASLLRRPELAAAVSDMRLLIVVDDEPRLLSDSSAGDQRTFADLSALGEAVPYDPARLTLSTQLVQDVLRSLVKLQFLTLEGAALAGSVLTSDLLAQSLKTLRHLGILVHISHTQDWSSHDNFACLPRNLATKLPSLSSVGLRHNILDLPVTLLSLPSSEALEPRSWHLDAFVLVDLLTVGPAIRNLYSSFSSLRSFGLDTYAVYDAFWDDFVRLPPSLRALNLRLTMPCSREASYRPSLPKLGQQHAFELPNLEMLNVSGDVLGPTSWPVLHTFPHLRRIGLGRHVELTLPALQAILDDFAGLPDLAVLQLDICECGDSAPRPTSARTRRPRRPEWAEGFKFAEAKMLLSAATEAGVVVRGTVLCAAKSCIPEDGHPCPGW
ncbi:hypothetical protein JCM10213_007554 [Rhodosporidiobolus nylandii]